MAHGIRSSLRCLSLRTSPGAATSATTMRASMRFAWPAACRHARGHTRTEERAPSAERAARPTQKKLFIPHTLLCAQRAPSNSPLDSAACSAAPEACSSMVRATSRPRTSCLQLHTTRRDGSARPLYRLSHRPPATCSLSAQALDTRNLPESAVPTATCPGSAALSHTT